MIFPCQRISMSSAHKRLHNDMTDALVKRPNLLQTQDDAAEAKSICADASLAAGHLMLTWRTVTDFILEHLNINSLRRLYENLLEDLAFGVIVKAKVLECSDDALFDANEAVGQEANRIQAESGAAIKFTERHARASRDHDSFEVFPGSVTKYLPQMKTWAN
jgi:hypothetical protein